MNQDIVGQITSTKKVLLEYIAKEQTPEGGFFSLASTELDFKKTNHYATNFAPALIGWCLSTSTEKKAISIRQKIASYLVNNRSDDGSWNYWDTRENGQTRFPCPNDMDDTIAAFLSLTENQPDAMSAREWATITKLLTATEVEPGGPYRTWLVKSVDRWNDIDVAINASIAYFLAVHQIFPSGLWTFLERAINTGRLYSPYYAGEVPLLYLLARAISVAPEKIRGVLEKRCSQRLQTVEFSGHHILATALLGLSWLYLRKPWRAWSAVKILLENGGRALGVEALWIDPAIQGVSQYAGGVAITAAYFYRVLDEYERIILVERHGLRKEKDILDRMKKRVECICGECGILPKRMEALLIALFKERSIGLISYDFWKELPEETRKNISEEIVIRLDVANLCGWLAYRIFDNIADEGIDQPLLWLGLRLFRASYDEYKSAAPNTVWREKVAIMFTTMEKALHQETLLSLDIVANKSIGHALGPLIILGHCHHALDSHEVVGLETFFRHYLTARQLNDDAHDWPRDKERGHSTPVTMLLGNNEKNLSVTFWKSVIDVVAARIIEHIQAAQKYIPAGHPQLERLLIPLEKAARKALTERDCVLQFIHLYQRSS